jgi:hypothetical protein
MMLICKELVERLSPDSLPNQMAIFILVIAKLLDLTSNWLLTMEVILISDMMIPILPKRTKSILIRFLKMSNGWGMIQLIFSLPQIILESSMTMQSN